MIARHIDAILERLVWADGVQNFFNFLNLLADVLTNVKWVGIL